MRIMVTGGAGFIGSAVIRRAIANGEDVLNVDKLTYAANLDNVADVAGHARYQFAQKDICDLPAMTSLMAEFNPDAVMNLAAETHVDRSIDGPGAFIQTNIVGVYSLLEAAKTYMENGAPVGFRFHHISTDEVYGSLGPTGEFTETSPYQPNSPYSAAKASSDMLARAWRETFNLPVIVTNCSNNYGPYQFPEKLIPVVVIAGLEGREIPIYGKGDNIRDWLFVEDHADALLLAARQGKPGETYNIGGRAERTNLELVKMICAILDEELPSSPHRPHENLITFVADRPGHDQRYAINCDKIEQELGWSPSCSIEEGMRNTVRWYLDNRDWWDAIRNQGFDVSARQGLGKKG
ncbi:dTDP-glucose 4,6-dehydratase [Hyphococcus flavus]|uniref:dTDP-glucose 4,6-dehydratase n=1 Tax=Hyphococcus flavus TaxID=1866326 RepID=A0AAE9ZCG0_9PROT|nr:dTDP-glucose 4,6-dehydratase [Hyphococcus flavus]WDI32348.1 dTDP-glucose 4,6-dehydratase [Hyphococcus flavus]